MVKGALHHQEANLSLKKAVKNEDGSSTHTSMYNTFFANVTTYHQNANVHPDKSSNNGKNKLMR